MLPTIETDLSASPPIDTTAIEVAACKNCDATLVAGQRYCAGCGQQASTRRLTLHEIGHDALHALLHVDRSVLSLVHSLLVRPGRVAREYVSGRRKRYHGPFAFLVVTVALGAAAIGASGFTAVTSDVPNSVVRFLQNHINLLFFVQVPILAAACRLLTPRGPFNYAEYLVLASYLSGMHILFFTLIDVGGWYLFKPSALLARVAYWTLEPVWPLYLALACAQFLPGSKLLAAGKGVAAWLITYGVTVGAASAAANIGQLLAAP